MKIISTILHGVIGKFGGDDSKSGVPEGEGWTVVRDKKEQADEADNWQLIEEKPKLLEKRLEDDKQKKEEQGQNQEEEIEAVAEQRVDAEKIESSTSQKLEASGMDLEAIILLAEKDPGNSRVMGALKKLLGGNSKKAKKSLLKEINRLKKIYKNNQKLLLVLLVLEKQVRGMVKKMEKDARKQEEEEVKIAMIDMQYKQTMIRSCMMEANNTQSAASLQFVEFLSNLPMLGGLKKSDTAKTIALNTAENSKESGTKVARMNDEDFFKEKKNAAALDTPVTPITDQAKQRKKEEQEKYVAPIDPKKQKPEST